MSVSVVITCACNYWEGQDGLQLLKSVREHWPKTKVITITAFGALETAVDAFRKQPFDHFTKPIRITDLIASVNRALNVGGLNQEEEENG